jgi:prolipoprotein diacylglyceryltransferase
LAAVIIWLGHHRDIKPMGQFALYVTGYSAYRIFEESIRVDSSEYFLGLRLNMFVASALTLAGAAWFIWIQRRGPYSQPAATTDSATAGNAVPGTVTAPAGTPGSEPGPHRQGGWNRPRP